MTAPQYEALRFLVLLILVEVTDSWLQIIWVTLAIFAVFRCIAASA